MQVLRGIAAFAVLLAHFFLVTPTNGRLEPNGLALGAIGVDVFFVISGFVVTMTVDRNCAAPSGFMFNRATRVLPLYFLVSLPLVLVEQLSFQKLWNTFLLAPIFDHGAYVNPVHWFGWSVAVEMWFYLLFSIAMMASRRLAVPLFAASILGLVATGTFWGTEWLLPHFLGTPLALEFLAGVLLYKSRASITIGTAYTALAVSAIWIGTISFPNSWLSAHGPSLRFAEFGFLRLIYWGIPAFLIVAAVVGFDSTRRVFWPKQLVWFGDISYSFYLVQPFAICAMRWIDLPILWMAWVSTFVLGLLLAAITNRCLEKPITRWLRDRNGRGSPKPSTFGQLPI